MSESEKGYKMCSLRHGLFAAMLIVEGACMPNRDLDRPLPAGTGAVTLDLRLVQESRQSVEFEYVLRNGLGQAIWVPSQWGTGIRPELRLPLAMVVPPDEVMFVSGHFALNMRGRQQIIEGDPVVSVLPLAAGEALSRRFSVSLPFDSAAQRIANPYEVPSEVKISETVKQIRGAVMVIQYWVEQPVPEGAEGVRLEACHQLTLAKAFLSGNKSLGIDHESFSRLALSRRCEVHLPLAQPLKIYVESGLLLPTQRFVTERAGNTDR